MAPLVPDIISNEFNYVIALIMGVGFGFALEQAGFSSTRKLVGLFYGYDFTVLKVFFTAGVTAMIGILFLSHFGLLNIDLIFVNPMFVKSAIIGGLIMGAGFIIGGFCPGTSAAAAAVGKVDAMAFLGGSVLGILAFTESYPLIEDLYLANNLGPVVISDFLGFSRISFAIILTLIAVLAFVLTSIIEDRVTGVKKEWTGKNIVKMVIYACIPFIVILFIAITPSRDEFVMKRLENRVAAGECKPKMIDSDKLAFEIINNYYKYNIIDVRSQADYDSFHIATAINIPLNKMVDSEYRNLFNQRIKTNVFYGSSLDDAKRACLLARFHGDDNGLALASTAEQFKTIFFNVQSLGKTYSRKELTIYTFREQASRKMKEIEESVSNISKPVEKKVRVIQGGCS
ncbi:MAG: YeeE/YedE family protein [Marinilabiliaceae bacterium]|nr:YeeE/YedE family protein [Marinilabiliaceae bacterium]